MLTLSATCLAIAAAHKAGELRIVAREGRFGQFFSIEDATGVIEVADTFGQANQRLNEVCDQLEEIAA
jgi:hypothetical protein